MPISFNADEILQMAEQIERNGIKFYTLSASRLKDHQAIFKELAAQEKEHLALFSKMRAKLSASEKETNAYDPDGENEFYLKALADREVFRIDDDPEKLFFPTTAFSDIINSSLEKEKDSIVFYAGMKKLVPETIGPNKIDLIIQEEFRHISILRGMVK
jgi:rubrerythrin